jgi:hypothetical protein
MNARANPLKGPSLFINPRPEALALQQSGCSGASESCPNDRDTGFAPHGTVTTLMECRVLCWVFCGGCFDTARSQMGQEWPNRAARSWRSDARCRRKRVRGVGGWVDLCSGEGSGRAARSIGLPRFTALGLRAGAGAVARRADGADWQGAGNVALPSLGHLEQGQVRFSLGEFVAARALFEQCHELNDPAHRAVCAAVARSDPYARIWHGLRTNWRPWAASIKDRSQINEVLGEPRRVGHVHTLLYVLGFAAFFELATGSPHEAHQHSRSFPRTTKGNSRLAITY